MRIHYWQFLIDEDGRPIPGATVMVHEAGFSVDDHLAVVYDDEIGGVPRDQATDPLETNLEGYFEFWVNPADYPDVNQKFRISWEKIGIASGHIDYIDIIPFIRPVNELDPFSEDKNRAVSNSLANLWNTHCTSTDHKVHGIEEVDETNPDTEKNKLLSNRLALDWEEHRALQFIDPWGEVPHPGPAPHGIEPYSTDDWDETPNRLVSNAFARNVAEHVQYDYSTGEISEDLPDTPHGLEPIDPGDIEDDPTPNKLVSNLLWRQVYNHIAVAARIVTFNIGTNSWTGSPGDYRADVAHGLRCENPVITVYNSSGEVIIPHRIAIVTANIVEIRMPQIIEMNVSIAAPRVSEEEE
jgi:hypothetical protein